MTPRRLTLEPGHGTQTIAIPAGVALTGDLTVPMGATGLIIFAHGSGSSRLSVRNQLVARRLEAGGFATLLFDLLTAEEEAIDSLTGHLRFDVRLLAERLARVTDWIITQRGMASMPVGYFGASTGAAAALIAGSARPVSVKAIVSRGGRPDLAGSFLGRVRAPTLLIVGGNDRLVIGMNQKALRDLTGAPTQLVVVPDAGHLFEEPGMLDRVANLALEWFARHLVESEQASNVESDIC